MENLKLVLKLWKRKELVLNLVKLNKLKKRKELVLTETYENATGNKATKREKIEGRFSRNTPDDKREGD